MCRRGLGFSPEAAPSWDADALFRMDKAGLRPSQDTREQGLKENGILGRILDIMAKESYLLQGSIYSNRQTIVSYYNGTMTCLLGRSGLWEFRVITPRHGLLLHGSEGKRVGAGGSQWKLWKLLGSGRRHVGDREGVGGAGGAGEVQEVQKRSGRLWESAEEMGRHGK